VSLPGAESVWTALIPELRSFVLALQRVLHLGSSLFQVGYSA
jgi:hypothetical protein